MNTATEVELKTHNNEVGKEAYIEAAKRFGGDQNWRLLQAMFELDSFSFDFSYIEKKLNLTRDEYREALKGFVDLGLIAEVDGEYRVINKTFTVPMDLNTMDDQLENHEGFMSNLAGLLSTERNSVYCSGYVASNASTVKKFQQKILEAFIEFNEESASVQKDGLYGLGFTATNLVNPEGDA